jgi:hypothetical protein
VGHTPQKSGEVLNLRYLKCIDTSVTAAAGSRRWRSTRGRSGRRTWRGNYERGEGKQTMTNLIFIIKPSQWEGLWVFDDPAVGLVREPFVGGADTIIDVATAHIPDADRCFLALFSAHPFPGGQMVLDWVREEGNGNVYRWTEKGMEGWLCPALLKYFERPPTKLYIQVKAAGNAPINL